MMHRSGPIARLASKPPAGIAPRTGRPPTPNTRTDIERPTMSNFSATSCLSALLSAQRFHDRPSTCFACAWPSWLLHHFLAHHRTSSKRLSFLFPPPISMQLRAGSNSTSPSQMSDFSRRLQHLLPSSRLQTIAISFIKTSSHLSQPQPL